VVDDNDEIPHGDDDATTAVMFARNSKFGMHMSGTGKCRDLRECYML
jgi:hypothetical protein